MNESKKTIGLEDLLEEVDRDLEDFRRKHPGDYSLKNISLWWDLEQERLIVRHKDVSVALVRRTLPSKRFWLVLGLALVMFATGVLVTLSLQ